MEEVIAFFTPERFLEIGGLLVGLGYLYFEYHANPLVWLMSVIMPMISMVIYFKAGIYADFAINIYYLIIAVYGYVAWSFNLRRRKKEPLPISHLPRGYYLPAGAVLAALFFLMSWALIRFTNSTVPHWDAFTTALSIVAMWMLARKYAEQWLAWFVVDAACAGLYFYKGIYFYSVLYAVYTVIALLGYRKWLRLMASENRV
ncbi:MAG: nicotinamide riboside transporter PnuC [Muribaculaceae bacterium]|nr:nicotinamide riboside transporter PnuC [Muribaculaceae bacterium]